MRTFTLEEAQSLLPVLESLLKRAIEGRRSAQAAESGLSEVAQRIYFAGGMRGEHRGGGSAARRNGFAYEAGAREHCRD